MAYCGFAISILLARLAFQAIIVARAERFASIWLCLAEPFVATSLNAGLVA